jgi:hypothetical protein
MVSSGINWVSIQSTAGPRDRGTAPSDSIQIGDTSWQAELTTTVSREFLQYRVSGYRLLGGCPHVLVYTCVSHAYVNSGAERSP